MSPVLTPAPPQEAPARLGRGVAIFALGALLAVGVIFAVSSALAGPTVAERFTVENPTPYLLEVDVASADGGGRLALGPVSPGERHSFSSVLDQGDRWVVAVTSARADGGQFGVRRSELEDRNWVVTIPDEVGRTLADDGAVPRSSGEE